MALVGQIFRPPSEAQSLLLQVTVGCSHNGCTYCAMYRDAEQRFRVKDAAEVEGDIRQAAKLAESAGVSLRRVFLCDGDALILSTRRLVDILELLRLNLPTVRRIGIYGDARSILAKSPDELRRLRELGLGIVYHGVESGDEEVLKRVNKGSTRQQTIAAAELLRQAGIRHSVIVMLGLGGVELSRQHADNTASLLSEIDPPYVGALTTTLVPGTPLAEQADRGAFELPDRWKMLRELETLVDRARFSRCTFHANHASNYLPLKLNLPADRQRGRDLLREVLETRDESRLTPEYWRGL